MQQHPAGTVRIGIDLGGTKIEALAIDAEGRELARKRIASPAHDYALTLDAIRGLVDEHRGRARHAGPRRHRHAGRGLAGQRPGQERQLDRSSTAGRSSPTWRRRSAREVRVANDADCFALSEASDGAGAGRRVVFGVILGTGVGGGLVVDGRLWVGPNAIAGEWGHNELPSRTEAGLPETRCYCGRRRCIETYLSGPGARGRSRPRSRAAQRRPPSMPGGSSPSPAPATPAAQARSAATAGAWRARSPTVINIVDPDIIVLGGGLSQVDELYPALPPLLAEYVFSDRCDTPVVRNRHGDASGVRGAAWLWPAREAG